ncbi:DUF1990 family protein, partial [Streptomyces nanshensis]|uniref:DUF1990 family protein n=1 Tax=Streptomyces nanshensis TaxID=518642 RepID=UPI00085C076A
MAGDAAHGAPPELNYPDAGATAKDPELWPEGFRRLRVSTQVGRGAADFAVAADAVMTWRLHRAAGVRFGTPALRAAPRVDVDVGLGIGRLLIHAPCRVVWTVDEPRRTGWGYGTLPGHPVRGEEAFVIVQDEAGTPGDAEGEADGEGAEGAVRLEVLAFSTPAVWFTALPGPLLPLFQRWYARRCGRVLRRLVRAARSARREA